ncbi:unnamed protein product [Aphanomyces euteiches]|uniref:Uncharacterized protein n=1 Tax=Aphanomyces euteiches TaxID=100861 RepID=A0A6G0WPB0_9STRA|nr:hypothetical protein Ae201684_013164 [Aphanomyces euteiches]KAH9076579.1 hypothetical protein Ae201684P_010519 [Aphanomyces euteiches]KAH9137588.1 hypothetical protein AeRB84_017757 [Aphanomyces euteiches]
MQATPLCMFQGCQNAATYYAKCDVHKHRTKCTTPSCENQTYARNRCVKHGGKPKCLYNGCDANVRSQGLCCRHGPGNVKSICQVDGCVKVAHARHRCVRHGGGLQCKVEGCNAHARSRGVCGRHRLDNHQSAILDKVESLSDLVGLVDIGDCDSDLPFGNIISDIELADKDKEILDRVLAPI